MSLAEQVAARIASEIFAGRPAPGERVPEQVLADRYQVSRGPIREALRLLEADGLVAIVPRRGAHVTKLTAHELRDIFEIRAHLIDLAMERLVREAEPDVVGLFRLGVVALGEVAADDPGSDAGSPGDGEEGGALHRDTYLDVSFRLTLLLADRCGNPRLGNIVRSLARQTRRYTRLGLATRASRRRSARGWRRALAAVGREDAEAAGAAVRDLVLRTRQLASEALERER